MLMLLKLKLVSCSHAVQLILMNDGWLRPVWGRLNYIMLRAVLIKLGHHIRHQSA